MFLAGLTVTIFMCSLKLEGEVLTRPDLKLSLLNLLFVLMVLVATTRQALNFVSLVRALCSLCMTESLWQPFSIDSPTFFLQMEKKSQDANLYHFSTNIFLNLFYLVFGFLFGVLFPVYCFNIMGSRFTFITIRFPRVPQVKNKKGHCRG